LLEQGKKVQGPFGGDAQVEFQPILIHFLDIQTPNIKGIVSLDKGES
jgi:hypothetical protein